MIQHKQKWKEYDGSKMPTWPVSVVKYLKAGPCESFGH